MKPKLRIEEIYAYVAVDDEGEGITAYLSPENGHWMPMVGADMDRMKSLAPVAQQLADKGDRPIKLIRYATRSELETLLPQERPAEELSHMVDVAELPPEEEPAFQAFDEPSAIAGTVYADSVVVAATLSERGPGIAIIYFIDGQPMPPLCVTGDLARDLVSLANDALAAITRIEN